MGLLGIDVLLDFVSSLAVLGLLVVGFSALGSNLKHSRFGPLVLGFVFGLVVCLQMSMPLSPAEGVIVDMRNVPIVLAGAFLGLRGLVMCLSVAIAARMGLGGVGVWAGVGGMLIAGAVGYAWSHLKQPVRTRDWAKLMALGVMVNLHMLSAFLAPLDIAIWYFREAVPTILLLNLICVPVIGVLLLREQNVADRHAKLAAAAQVDPVTRLLSLDAFAQEVSHFNASGTGARLAGVIAITIKNANWLKQTWGETAIDQSMGALRVRVADLCPDIRPLGIDSNRRMLVPVTDAEMRDLRPFRKTLRRLASDLPFTLDGNVEVPLTVVVENFSLRQPDQPGVTLSDVHRSATPRRAQMARKTASPQKAQSAADSPLPSGLCNVTLGRLFEQADERLRRAA